MKYKLLLFLLLLIPFFAYAETCDNDKISIDSISIEEKTDSVTEKKEASATGKDIDLNLSMLEVGDNIKYKIVIKNDSNEDYEIEKNSFNIGNEYINYLIESDDDSNIVKANSSKTLYLKIEYKNEVPDSAFETGSYKDEETMTVNLSFGTENVDNPNTGLVSYELVCMYIFIAGAVSYMVLKRKNYFKVMVIVLGALLFIPMNASSLCKCEVSIKSNVEINKIGEFYFDNNTYNFVIGMTWREFLDSEYNVDGWTTTNYTLMIHSLSGTDTYYYIPDDGVGIKVDEDSYGCGNGTAFYNKYVITSNGNIELLDNIIIDQFTYNISAGNAC